MAKCKGKYGESSFLFMDFPITVEKFIEWNANEDYHNKEKEDFQDN